MENLTKLLCIGFLFVSCKANEPLPNTSKDSVKSQTNLAQDFINFIEQDFDAIVGMQSSCSFNSSSLSENSEAFSAGLSFYPVTNPNAVALNSNILNGANEYFIQNSGYAGNLSTDIFGQSVEIKFDNEVLEPNFYCVTRLNASYDDVLHPGTVAPGMNFTWNSDPLSQGVIVKLLGLKSHNPNLTDDIEKILIIEDNGSFSIPNDWLNEFSQGDFVRIEITRGTYKLATTSGGENIRIGSLSSCSSTFMVE